MGTNGYIIPINPTPKAVMSAVATRVRDRRLEINLSQKDFASKAGVGFETYRKFEKSGSISLHNLILIGIALNMADDFAALFSEKQFQSIDDILNEKNNPTRKRASRNG